MKKIICLVFLLFISASVIMPQGRIPYNNKNLFLNGVNLAWFNFARDIGPGTTDFTKFGYTFRTIHEAGGNSIRFWLHTNGDNTPEFNYSNVVTGPGTNTISDLKTILDSAWSNNVGLMLCLWSFDMLRASNVTRTKLLLTDTAYTNAYIRNCLIPMVTALKGHPGILCWEIFNEPEGMSNELGWKNLNPPIKEFVPMSNIQRFINLCSGAIHRIDPSAKVTNGSWSFKASTDVVTGALKKTTLEDMLSKYTEVEKRRIEKQFNEHYGGDLTFEEIIRPYTVNASPNAENYNYYTDARLRAAGGDPDGILDFYTVHYYDWAGTALSPFHHPYSYWKLDKPIAVSEFYTIDTYGVRYQDLFPNLYNNGYAGAMSWAWTDNSTSTQAKMLEVMNIMLMNYPADVLIKIVSGDIYKFTASSTLVEQGDNVILSWKAAAGSTVTLDGQSVALEGEKTVSPTKTTSYVLASKGETSTSRTIQVKVKLSGIITSFTANPDKVSPGEKSMLRWNVTNGAAVTLNGTSVATKDSLVVSPTVKTDYTLSTVGDYKLSQTVTVDVVSPDQVNRAQGKSVVASSSDANASYSNPANIVDGNSNTRWASANTDVQSLEVDLLDSYQIKKIILDWYGSQYAKSYRIAVSPDKKSYQLVTNNTNGQGGIETYDSLNFTGRYVKIFLDKRVTNLAFSLNEVEIYGLLGPSAVDDKPLNVTKYQLSQNYPNPFNPVTTLEYSLPEKSFVTLEVYNILGNKVETLVSEYKNTGNHKVSFDGSELPSGIYFYRMKAGSFSQTGKMTLMK